MNYLTGLTLGISAGRQLHQFLRNRGFTLVHALPGRRRYAHKDLLHDPELALRWERQVQRIPGIQHITFNAVTGTVLVEYSCPDSHIDFLMEYLHQIHQAPDPGAPYSKLGMDIRGFFQKINSGIRENTGHRLDLSTLLAAWMAVSGLTKVWVQGQRPAGPQMLWWAYSLLCGRRL